MDHCIQDQHQNRLLDSERLPVYAPHDVLPENKIESHWTKLLATQPGRVSLWELLTTHADSFCEDPRDKVYALVNLASDCRFGNGIQADYTKDLAQVAFDTSLHLSQSKIDWIHVSPSACETFLEILIWLTQTILSVTYDELIATASKTLWHTQTIPSPVMLKTFAAANFTSMTAAFGIARKAEPAWLGGTRIAGLPHLIDPLDRYKAPFMYFKIDVGCFERRSDLHYTAYTERSPVHKDSSCDGTHDDAKEAKREDYVHQQFKFLVISKTSDQPAMFQLSCSLLSAPSDLAKFQAASNFDTDLKFREFPGSREMLQTASKPVRLFYLAFENGMGYLLTLEDKTVDRVEGYLSRAHAEESGIVRP